MATIRLLCMDMEVLKNNNNNFDRQNNRNQCNCSGSNDHDHLSRHSVPVITVVAEVVVAAEEEEDVVASRICRSAVRTGCCVQPQRIFWIHSFALIDRPEEIFFHYLQLQGMHAADLHMDDEVEFRVGTSAKDADKLATFQV